MIGGQLLGIRLLFPQPGLVRRLEGEDLFSQRFPGLSRELLGVGPYTITSLHAKTPEG